MKVLNYKQKVYTFLSELADRRGRDYKLLFEKQEQIIKEFGNPSVQLTEFWDSDYEVFLKQGFKTAKT